MKGYFIFKDFKERLCVIDREKEKSELYDEGKTIREMEKSEGFLDVIVDEDFHLFTFQRFGILVELLRNPDY